MPVPATSTAPVRSCVGCRAKRPQTELVRCVVEHDGRPVISRTAAGRGAWLCATRTSQDTDCLQQAIKKRGFDRAWKRPVGRTEHDILTIAYDAITKNMKN